MTSSAAERETLLARTFVDLVDTLVDDYDVVDLFNRLVVASVDLLKATAAGLLLDDQRGGISVVASSSEQSQLLEIFQLQANEGPCLDCIRSGTSVVSEDLTEDVGRWPKFAPAAVEVGFRSVVAVPMRLRTDTIGGLNLFSTVPGALVNSHVLARALADVATVGILQQRTAHRSAMVAEQLQFALNSRVIIEQAKGIIAERRDLEVGAAFDLIRKYARAQREKITDVAKGIIAGTLDPVI